MTQPRVVRKFQQKKTVRELVVSGMTIADLNREIRRVRRRITGLQKRLDSLLDHLLEHRE